MDKEEIFNPDDWIPREENISPTFEIQTAMILGDSDDFKNLPGNAAKVYLVIMAFTAYDENPIPSMKDIIELL